MVAGRHSHVRDNEGEKREPKALGKIILLPWRCHEGSTHASSDFVCPWSCWLQAWVAQGKTLDLKIGAIEQSLADRVQALEHSNEQALCRDATAQINMPAEHDAEWKLHFWL